MQLVRAHPCPQGGARRTGLGLLLAALLVCPAFGWGQADGTPEEEPVLLPNGPWLPGPALPTVRTASENTSEHDKLL